MHVSNLVVILAVAAVGSLSITLSTIYLLRKLLERKLGALETRYLHRYAKLHGDRLDVLRELYRLLVKVEAPARQLMAPVKRATGKTDDELAKEVSQSLAALIAYYDENELLFDTATGESIDRLKLDFDSMLLKYAQAQAGKERDSEVEWREAIREMDEGYRQLVELDLPQLKGALTTSFQATFNPQAG